MPEADFLDDSFDFVFKVCASFTSAVVVLSDSLVFLFLFLFLVLVLVFLLDVDVDGTPAAFGFVFSTSESSDRSWIGFASVIVVSASPFVVVVVSRTWLIGWSLSIGTP